MAVLRGLRIVVTRAAHQAEELAAPLRQLGAEIILLPTIAIGPPADSRPLQDAASRANEYDWIVFTSQNSVEAFASHGRWGKEQKFKAAAVGGATRETAERHGITVHLVPEKYVAESLAGAFGSEALHGRQILIPSAAVTRDVVSRELEKLGAVVTVVEAYRNTLPEGTPARASQVFRNPLPDWVLFASPSAVDHLVALVELGALRQVKIATIGPVTSKAVERHGLSVTAEANPHDVNGLVAAVMSCGGLRAAE